MQIFKLINLETQELVDKTDYADGAKAAKVAQRLTARTGRKYQVRKIDPNEGDPNWRERERARFDSGEYIPLIDFLHNIQPDDTFGHVAKKDPGLIAYTKDEYKGRTDKQSLISVEGFLDMCMARMCERLEQDRKDAGFKTVEDYLNCMWGMDWKQRWINAQIRHATEKTSPVLFIGPVSNPDDEEEVNRIAQQIEERYLSFDSNIHALAASCMRNEAEYYSTGGVHPVAAYASPDLALAYMVDRHNRTIARAICWPAKKLYTRIYAGTNTLDNALKALGYERSGYYGGDGFHGARMRKIEKTGFVVMPYIDGNHHCGEVTDDQGTWITMGGNKWLCDRTDGRAYPLHDEDEDDDENGHWCPHCEETYDDDNSTTVYLNSGRTRSEQWCTNCVENDAFYCNGYGEYFSDNVDCTYVCDEPYTTRYVENNATWCDRYEEYTFDSTYQVVINEDGDTQTWCDSATSDGAFEFDGLYYSEDLDFVPVVTRRYVMRQNRQWISGHGHRTINAWYSDEVEQVPQYLIDNEEVDVYTGVDGRLYLRDYIDYYPLSRERVQDRDAANLYPSAAHTFLDTPPVLTPYDEGRIQSCIVVDILRAEREARAIAEVIETAARDAEWRTQSERDAELLDLLGLPTNE